MTTVRTTAKTRSIVPISRLLLDDVACPAARPFSCRTRGPNAPAVTVDVTDHLAKLLQPIYDFSLGIFFFARFHEPHSSRDCCAAAVGWDSREEHQLVDRPFPVLLRFCLIGSSRHLCDCEDEVSALIIANCGQPLFQQLFFVDIRQVSEDLREARFIRLIFREVWSFHAKRLLHDFRVNLPLTSFFLDQPVRSNRPGKGSEYF